MSKDAPLKSAYELAMERLRRQDREAGIEESQPLTEPQKKRINKLRRKAQAELAELEILRDSKRADVGNDPEKLRTLEEHDTIDRKRIASRLETEIRKIRENES